MKKAATPPKSQPRVIAAIPCFNTEQFIRDIVLRTRKQVNEVVVIDDGSRDKTAEVARLAGAQVVSHQINKGYGEAIRSGFRAAKDGRADILVTIDGDGQHNPDEIPGLLAPILQGQADVTIGSRFLSNGSNIPLYRRFGIKVITFLTNFGVRHKITDAQSGFRAYSKKALEVISPTESGMSISIETLVRIRKAGLTVKEVPISCHYHENSSSRNPVIHGIGVALAVVKLRTRHIFTKKPANVG